MQLGVDWYDVFRRTGFSPEEAAEYTNSFGAHEIRLVDSVDLNQQLLRVYSQSMIQISIAHYDCVKEMGVTRIGHRLKILRAIQDLRVPLVPLATLNQPAAPPSSKKKRKRKEKGDSHSPSKKRKKVGKKGKTRKASEKGVTKRPRKAVARGNREQAEKQLNTQQTKETVAVPGDQNTVPLPAEKEKEKGAETLISTSTFIPAPDSEQLNPKEKEKEKEKEDTAVGTMNWVSWPVYQANTQPGENS